MLLLPLMAEDSSDVLLSKKENRPRPDLILVLPHAIRLAIFFHHTKFWVGKLNVNVSFLIRFLFSSIEK